MNLNLLRNTECFPTQLNRVWGCAIVLLLAIGVSGLEGAIAPQSVQAYVARVDLGIDRLPNESYDSMVRRAELISRAAAQRTFDKDILATEASVMVVGRNAGAEAPILTLTVTREQWRSRPDPQRWATYYRNSLGLLRVPASSVPVIPQEPAVPATPAVPEAIAAPVPKPLTKKQAETAKKAAEKAKPAPQKAKPVATPTKLSAADPQPPSASEKK